MRARVLVGFVAVMLGALSFIGVRGRANAQADPRPTVVAVFNISRVFLGASDMKKLASELQVLIEPRERDLRQQIADLEKKLGGLTAESSKEERQDLIRRHQSATAQLVDLGKQADRRKLDTIQRMNEKLQKATREAARQKGVDLLLAVTDLEPGTAASPGAFATAMSGRAVWQAGGAVQDITEAVILEMEK